MSNMSELDREVQALDMMDRDELRCSCEEQLYELYALRRQVAALKEEIKRLQEVK